MAFSRRRWISSVLAIGSVAWVVPMRLFASTTAAFATDNADTVISELFGSISIEESSAIKFKIPDIAENGAVVPVTVSTDIEGVLSISIVVDNNPNPLSASFVISPDVVADISTRVKMGKSSRVRAFVQTADKVFFAAKEVKVTIGGCGG